ncbi:hypothetical protein PTSG_11734 [Salpingoeca rosetta]|uniref:DH domain-containing protein n=1 Tax=Salpingoeca rosetta (strain ATCC 50818 / BSB-021) TaxID=946362 RepID=F2U0E1_SALR5|nr:uncharacterized protein PTSG_11734 [Salpingoeca rosetta]EGD80869.1 hypothetical protein PTSG_11734 [Salpingoeca rosetta]|eukprot:XP_004997430.1 hypothetical protein PTSG_11734 [Salpingoeca rosetta]
MHVFIVCDGNLSQETAQDIFESLDSTVARFLVTPSTLKTKGLEAGDVVVCSPFEGPFFNEITSSHPEIRVVGPRVAALDTQEWESLPRVVYGVAPLFTDGIARFTVYLEPMEDEAAMHTALQRLEWMGADIVAEAKQASVIFAPPTSEASQTARRSHVGRVFEPEFIHTCWHAYTDSLGYTFPNAREHQTAPLAGCRVYLSMTGVSETLKQKLVTWVSELGADVAPSLDHGVTHFICNTLDGSGESAQARKLGAIPVKHTWLVECWRTRNWQDEGTHRPAQAQRPAPASPYSNKVIMFLNNSNATPTSPRDRASTIATDSPASESRKRKHVNTSVVTTRGQDFDDDVDMEAEDGTPRRKTPKKGSHMTPTSPAKMSKDMRGMSAPMLSLKAKAVASRASRSKAKAKSAPDLDVARKNNVMELYKCEANVSRIMGVVEELFHKPLKLDPADAGFINRIFRSTAKIRDFAGSVAKDLKEQLDNWSEHPAIISHVFHRERMTQYQTLYKRVVTQADDSQAALKELMKNKTFAHFIRQQEADPRCDRKQLRDMLMEPVQHIMRYNLHLEKIIKNTPENHPDALPLREVQECFRTIVQDTDETKRVHEELVNFQLTLHMIEDFPPELYSARRACVAMEEVVSCANRKDTVMLILLTDHLVVVRGQSKKIEWRQTFTFGRNRRKDFQFVTAHHLKSTSIHDVMEARTVDGAILDQSICVRYNPQDTLLPNRTRTAHTSNIRQETSASSTTGPSSSSSSSSSASSSSTSTSVCATAQPPTLLLSSSSSSTASSAASSQRSSRNKKGYDSHAYYRFMDEGSKRAFLQAARQAVRNLTGRLTPEMQGDEEQCRHAEAVEQSSRQRCTFGEENTPAAKKHVAKTPRSATKAAFGGLADAGQDLLSRMRARSNTISQFDARHKTLGGRRFSSNTVQAGARGSRFMQGVSFKDCASTENLAPHKPHDSFLRSSLGGRLLRNIVKRASKTLRTSQRGHSSKHHHSQHQQHQQQQSHEALGPLQEHNHQKPAEHVGPAGDFLATTSGSSSSNNNGVGGGASKLGSRNEALRSPKRSTQL